MYIHKVMYNIIYTYTLYIIHAGYSFYQCSWMTSEIGRCCDDDDGLSTAFLIYREFHIIILVCLTQPCIPAITQYCTYTFCLRNHRIQRIYKYMTYIMIVASPKLTCFYMDLQCIQCTCIASPNWHAFIRIDIVYKSGPPITKYAL